MSNTRELTEHFTETLRNNDIDGFTAGSPYAACLFPLLRALGWKNIVRELIEALPHFASEIDLVDLRNILVNLGYDSNPIKVQLNQLKAELYPSIFVSISQEVFVLISKSDQKINYFDAQEEKMVCRPSTELNFSGTAYLFTDKHLSHGMPADTHATINWFGDLTDRFRKMILHLFSMTFVINLVALLIPLFIMIIYDKVIGSKSLDSLPLLLSGVAILIVADLVLRYFRANILGAVAGRMDYLVATEKQSIHLKHKEIT